MRRRAPAAIAILLAAVAFAAVAQSVASSPLPAPTGRYAVGRMQVDLTNPSRPDRDASSGHREITVWLWYPAARGAPSASWMPGKWGELYWADFMRGHAAATTAVPDYRVTDILAHSSAEAPLPPGRESFPIVLFAPGLGAIPLEYAGVIEDIASHGYVVAGVASTYLAGFAVFRDGRVVMGRGIAPPSTGGASARPSPEDAIRQFESAADLISKDLSFTLDQLSKLNQDAQSMFHGRLDSSRVGVIGHSLGGAAVLQCAHDDPRILAAFDIDGSPIWKSSNRSIEKPVLVLSAAATNLGYGAVLNGAKPGLQLTLAGTVHTFSTDLRSMPFLKTTRAAAAIEPNRALSITATYAEAFFDRYLRKQASDLLDGPSARFPEISFQRGGK